MNWIEAEKLMRKRGYSAAQIARSPGFGEIKLIHMAKTFHVPDLIQPDLDDRIPYIQCGMISGPKQSTIAILAEITCLDLTCDTCWHVRLKYNGLKRFMAIDSYPFWILRKDFEDIEKDIVAYAALCKNASI